MLGIPLHRSSPSHTARSHSQRRSSSSPVSHRSSPASSPAKPFTVTTERVRHHRGSSTPSRLDREPSVNRTESKRTNKFNIRNLLAKIASGNTSPRRGSSDDRRCHQMSCDRAMTSRMTRRSISQTDKPTHTTKRSLSASAPLRRARINDSTSSISGVSTISQYYPSAVAAQRLSPSPARCPAVRVAGSLRSSAGSVWTAPDSLPDSVSTNSLGSVFSLKSSSTGASPALWTPFSPAITGLYSSLSLITADSCRQLTLELTLELMFDFSVLGSNCFRHFCVVFLHQVYSSCCLSLSSYSAVILAMSVQCACCIFHKHIEAWLYCAWD